MTSTIDELERIAAGARRAAWRALGARAAARWPAAFQTLGVLGLNIAAWLAWGGAAGLATASASVLVVGVLREAGLI